MRIFYILAATFALLAMVACSGGWGERPEIVQGPVNQTVISGQTATFSVTAAGTAPLKYQWFESGVAISGATGSTYTTPVTAGSDNGSVFSVTVTNAAGGVASASAILTVNVPPAIVIPPLNQTVISGQTATFSVTATGTAPLVYQWFRGSSAISGATSSSYTTPVTAGSDNGAVFSVVVSSSAATLSVSDTDTEVPPTIIVEPVGETATVGGTATFSVTASGSGTLSYQWYRVPYSSTELTNPTAGAAISGATSSTYTTPVQAQSNDGDNYYVVVTGSNGLLASSEVIYGSAVSSRVDLAVGAGILLQITSEPHTDYVGADTLASFSVGATCTGCIPAYQWWWYQPGSTTAVALINGAGTGDLAGATVDGATTSSLTLENAPTSASTGIFYVVVTSTSDGSTQITNTNSLTSSTAGLFVGSLGSIGNTTAGEGLCNTGSSWVLNGRTGSEGGTVSGGTSSGGPESTVGVPYQDTGACTIEMTDDKGNESAAVYWPTLISTANFSVSYTVTLSNDKGGTPADGFAMILADPSQGATTSSTGLVGEGMGASGIPGFVLGFDTFQNGNLQGNSNPATCIYVDGDINTPCDPVTVPYMAVGQGATALWENPWTFVNGALNTQSSTDYTPAQFVPTSGSQAHNYVVTVVNSVMTVTMDSFELFSGTVSLPPAAYLGFTASTGGSEETVVISNLTATVSAP